MQVAGASIGFILKRLPLFSASRMLLYSNKLFIFDCMKHYSLILALLTGLIFSPAAQSQNVTIIESQTMSHPMDQVWLNIVTGMGMTGSIYPQTTLDNTAFIPTTDILIVASGVINIPANRVNNILVYLLQGGMVYLQTEYDTNFTANGAFSYLVNTLGGGFQWNGSVSGTLFPTVTGTLATTPNTIPPLGYFWWGADADICGGVESFLNYANTDLGFIFCGNNGAGRIITTTDQDWIINALLNDSLLMENIVYNLTDSLFSCNTQGVPVSALGPDTTVCAGDTVLLHAGGGFNSYLWQNGSTDSLQIITAPGTYWVTLTSSCNTYTDTVHVLPANCSAPNIVFGVSDSSFCEKTCVDFYDFSTGNPISWQWYFPGADSTSSNMQNPIGICYNSYGSFDVTLIACNSIGCDTLTITAYINEWQPPPTPVVTISNDTLYSTPAVTYQWYNTSGIIPGATGQFYVSPQPGSYYVVITDANGCVSTSAVVTTGVDEIYAGNQQIVIIPNPSSGEFFINAAVFSGEREVKIHDSAGRTVYSGTCHNRQTRISLDLESGIYFITLYTKNETVTSRLVIIR